MSFGISPYEPALSVLLVAGAVSPDEPDAAETETQTQEAQKGRRQGGSSAGEPR